MNTEYDDTVNAVKISLSEKKKEEEEVAKNGQQLNINPNDIRTPFKPLFEYRILSKPRLLLSKNSFTYSDKSRNIDNKNKEYEYEYEVCNRSKNIRVITFSYLSDVFNYFEKKKFYYKEDQEKENFVERQEYYTETNEFTLRIDRLCYYEIPILQQTNLLNGSKTYYSLSEARKLFKKDNTI